MLVKEQGVNPVIAELLMISITIILVASVYVMVTNGIISTPYGTNQLNGALIIDYSKSNSTSLHFTVILNHPSKTHPEEVKIIIIPVTGKVAVLTYKGNFIWNNKTPSGSWYYQAKLIDNDGDKEFSNEDYLIVNIVKELPNTSPPPFENGYKIKFSIDTYSGSSAGGVVNF